MNNKQSSVEKMFQEMLGIQQEGIKLTFDENLLLLGKYKEMHKKEILGSWGNGWVNGDVDVNRYEDTAEKFYNEEFGE